MDRTQDSLLLSVQLSGPVLASEEPQLGFQKPSLGTVLVYDDDDVVCTPANHLSEGFPSVFLSVGSRLTSLQFTWLTKQKKASDSKPNSGPVPAVFQVGLHHYHCPGS